MMNTHMSNVIISTHYEQHNEVFGILTLHFHLTPKKTGKLPEKKAIAQKLFTRTLIFQMNLC